MAYQPLKTETTCELGQLMRALREARRMSQSQLANRAELDHSYISRLERGTRTPTREAIHLIADALDLPLTDSNRDRMLAAAGFAPDRLGSLLSLRRLGELNDQLRDADAETVNEVDATLCMLINSIRFRRIVRRRDELAAQGKVVPAVPMTSAVAAAMGITRR